MEKTQKVLSIFVSSPSDVSEERQHLKKVVSTINQTLAKHRGVSLQLLGSEDVIPGFGSDPQSVINEQIPEDYDIFLGILWHRFGTPTGRAPSGTIEEFERAKARHDKDPKSVRLMLYFKTAPPLSLRDIDPSQLASVEKFRCRVKEEGGFYGEFAAAEDFANIVHTHLTDLVFSESGVIRIPTYKDSKVEPQPETDDYEDEGLFDLQEAADVEMAELSILLSRMNEAIEDVGKAAKQRTNELESIVPSRNAPPNVKWAARARARRILKKYSSDLDQFVAVTRKDLPLYREHLDRGIGAITRMVPIGLEISVDKEDKDEYRKDLSRLTEAMGGMLESMEGLQYSLRALPRLSSDLLRSRRSAERVLQEIIDITNGARISLGSVLKLLS